MYGAGVGEGGTSVGWGVGEGDSSGVATAVGVAVGNRSNGAVGDAVACGDGVNTDPLSPVGCTGGSSEDRPLEKLYQTRPTPTPITSNHPRTSNPSRHQFCRENRLLSTSVPPCRSTRLPFWEPLRRLQRRSHQSFFFADYDHFLIPQPVQTFARIVKPLHLVYTCKQAFRVSCRSGLC